MVETLDRIIYRVLDCPISIEPEKDRECVSMGFNLQESKLSLGSHAIDASVGSAWVQCPEEPWAYGAELCLRLPHSTELDICSSLRLSWNVARSVSVSSTCLNGTS